MPTPIRDLPAIKAEATRLAREHYEAERAAAATVLLLDMEPWAAFTGTREGFQQNRVAAQLALLSDLSRPASRDRLARWLAEGERCPDCDGAGRVDATGEQYWINCRRCGGGADRVGSGHLRAPTPLWWALDGPGPLTPEESAAVLSWSVRSVAAGGKPIAGVLDRWSTSTGFTRQQRRTCAGTAHILVQVGEEVFYGRHDYRRGWRVTDADDQTTIASGDTIDDAGLAAADAAAMAARYALHNPDGTLTLPPLPAPRSTP